MKSDKVDTESYLTLVLEGRSHAREHICLLPHILVLDLSTGWLDAGMNTGLCLGSNCPFPPQEGSIGANSG